MSTRSLTTCVLALEEQALDARDVALEEERGLPELRELPGARERRCALEQDAVRLDEPTKVGHSRP